MEPAPAPPETPAPSRCLNCGEPAPGKFCPACGQRQDRKLASVRRMAVEGLQDQLSLGSELPVTLSALLFRPGKLTTEYLAGRIARYVPPLRLYLVASLAFFFILSFQADFDEPLVQAGEEIQAAQDSAAATADSVARQNPLNIGVSFDTAGATGRLGDLKRWGQRRVDHLNSMERDELARAFMDGFQRNAPRAVFVLLPIYALILKLLYARRGRLYAEHFVFALHIHAFVFVLFSLLFITPEWMDQAMLMLWTPLYVFLAMKRVYAQSIPKTLLKYGILFLAYCSVLLVLLVATVVAVALTI